MSQREFREVLTCVTEVLYGSLFGATDEPGSRRLVGELADLVAPNGVAFPDLQPFGGSLWVDGQGWGARPSAEELLDWRGFAPAVSRSYKME